MLVLESDRGGGPAAQRGMSIAEFCRRYGVGRTTTYSELRSGRLRARKIGKRTIITTDDAEAWLERLPIVASEAGSDDKRGDSRAREHGSAA